MNTERDHNSFLLSVDHELQSYSDKLQSYSDDHYILPKEILSRIFRSTKELWYASRMVCNQIRKICVDDIIKCECLSYISLFEIQREIEKGKTVGLCENRVKISTKYIRYESEVSVFEKGWCNTKSFVYSENQTNVSCDLYGFGYHGDIRGFINKCKLLDIHGDSRGRNLAYPVFIDVITAYNILKRRFKYLVKDLKSGHKKEDYAKTLVKNMFTKYSQTGKDLIKNMAISYYYMCTLGVGVFHKKLGLTNDHKKYQSKAVLKIIGIIKEFKGVILEDFAHVIPPSYIHEEISIHKYKLMEFKTCDRDYIQDEDSDHEKDYSDDYYGENELLN